MMDKLITLLGGILRKPHDVTYRVAGKVGMAIGHFLVDMVYVAVFSAVILAIGVSWVVVPALAALLLSGQGWDDQIEESFIYYWIAFIFVWVIVTGLAKIKFSK